ncbi:MAG: peptidylprolyl isomerase, partial [Casimicrobiaceae bacterium]
GRIVDYKAAAIRPFDEVKDEIRRQLTRRDASALAQKAGAARMGALEAGKSDKDAGVSFAKPEELLRSQTGPGMPPDALVRVFSVNPGKLPAYVGATNERGGYSIYRVSKVIEPEKLDDARLKLATTRMGEQVGRELLTAYLAGLKARADVKINQVALERKVAQP